MDVMAFQEMQVRNTDQVRHLGQGLSITWFLFSTYWSHDSMSDLDPSGEDMPFLKCSTLAHWNENALCGIL